MSSIDEGNGQEYMAATIEVAQEGDDEFLVGVIDRTTRSSHRVTLKTADYKRLSGGKVTAAELVRVSFEFLLEHEPKESILARFDLTVIAHYFPAFESELARRLLRLQGS